jgi:hypothetical protein
MAIFVPVKAPLDLVKTALICPPNNPTIKIAAMAIIARMMRYSVMLMPQRVILGPSSFIFYFEKPMNPLKSRVITSHKSKPVKRSSFWAMPPI